MDWKPEKWKLKFKGSKDQWLVVLAIGLIFLILAFPMGGKKKTTGAWIDDSKESAGSGEEKRLEGDSGSSSGNSDGLDFSGISSSGSRETGSVGTALTYEQQLEVRLKELLSHVDGVGEVEVMIVLKSSEEKVWRVDRNTSYSSTRETDSNGGTRDIRSQEISEGTILSVQNGSEEPLLEKELKPEISGVVVTATGGGSPAVQAEISAAVEALFDVPSHKIKVLKRVE